MNEKYIGLDVASYFAYHRHGPVYNASYSEQHPDIQESLQSLQAALELLWGTQLEVNLNRLSRMSNIILIRDRDTKAGRWLMRKAVDTTPLPEYTPVVTTEPPSRILGLPSGFPNI